MSTPTWKTLIITLVVSSGLLLAGCNSGSSSSDSPPPPAAQDSGVEGPLDALQEPLSTQVFANLSASAAGTPLETAINCLDQFLVNDVLDVLDGVLVDVAPALESDPQSILSAAVPTLELAVADLAADLTALQSSLTGGACTVPDSGDGGESPLAGTPLAPLGEALAGLPAPPSDASLAELEIFLGQMRSAIEEGLAALSGEDSDAVDVPILGGALLTIQAAVADLEATLEAAAAGDPAAVQSSIAATVDNLLNNILTQVLPIAAIEEATGQQGLLSTPIGEGVAAITALFDQDPAALLGGDGDNEGGSGAELPPEISALLGPLSEVISPALLEQIATAITDGEGLPPTGTPLDAILAPLSDVEALIEGGEGDGLTGTPLDLLLAEIEQALAEGNACPVASTPLDPVCTIVADLQAALEADPDADPLALLSGIIDSVLGGLL